MAASADQRMGFMIWCSNTVCDDGTELRNDGPAPEFIITTLEERTGLKRPPNAAACRLDDLNLYFTSGGAIMPARVSHLPTQPLKSQTADK